MYRITLGASWSQLRLFDFIDVRVDWFHTDTSNFFRFWMHTTKTMEFAGKMISLVVLLVVPLAVLGKLLFCLTTITKCIFWKRKKSLCHQKFYSVDHCWWTVGTWHLLTLIFLVCMVYLELQFCLSLNYAISLVCDVASIVFTIYFVQNMSDADVQKNNAYMYLPNICSLDTKIYTKLKTWMFCTYFRFSEKY